MFGKNPIRSVERDPASIAIQEIFYTLQGEGPYTGHPAVFVRTAGCNLACTFCDTEFESNINHRMTPKAVVEAVHRVAMAANLPSQGMRLVVLTGGEPLRQACAHMIKALLEAGVKHVQIETAGTVWDTELNPFVEAGTVSIVCSPKTPKVHPAILRYCHHYKYIITAGHLDHEDGLPVGGTQKSNMAIRQRLFRPWDVTEVVATHATIWVSPCDAHDGAQTAKNTQAAVKSALFFGYRLSLQTHKMVGVP